MGEKEGQREGDLNGKWGRKAAGRNGGGGLKVWADWGGCGGRVGLRAVAQNSGVVTLSINGASCMHRSSSSNSGVLNQ